MSNTYRIDELARSLKRYWIADVQAGSVRMAQASSSGWQSWTINHLAAADPHPVYLTKPEGDALYVPLSRTLTAGNLMQTIGTLGVDRTIAVDPNKLTVTGGKLAVTVPSTKTLTLDAPNDTALTLSTSGTLNLGGGSYLGAGFTVQAPASGTMALGAATLSFSSINNFSTSSHSHAVTGTQSGASNTFVATTANGDIVAGRDLTAVRYVGGGIASPTNALHGRDASGSQLRLDDGTNYAVFSVSGSGDLTMSLINSTRFVKHNNLSSTAAFTSGFSGSGWRMDYGVTRSGYTSLEVDDLVVRGRMRVYELLIHQIRFGTGSYLFTPGMKAVTVTGSGPYTLVGDPETPHGLAVDDLCRAQRFTGTGVYQSNVRVTTVTNAYTVVVTLSSGDAPAAGMEFARLGNVTDASRRGSVYITSDDSGAPFLDVNDGVAAFGDFGSAAKNKVRIGNLSGYTDPFWGALTGYGIVTSNGYFRNVKINGTAYIGNGVGFGWSPQLHLPYNTTPAGITVNTNGHLGQKVVVPGGIGTLKGKFGTGGATFSFAGTNLILNPRFANAATGYVGGSNTANTIVSDSLMGGAALQVVASGTGNRYVYNTVTRLSTGNPLTVSAWVRSIGAPAQLRIGVWTTGLAAANVGSYVTVGNDKWYLIYWQASAANLTSIGATTSVNVLIQNDADTASRTFLVGWVQAEEVAYVSPPIDGSMGPGFSWASAPHASKASRSVAGFAQYRYEPTMIRQGSAMGWFQFMPGVPASDTRVMLDTRTASFANGWRLFIAPTNVLTWRDGAGADILTYNVGTLDPNVHYHAAVTWDHDNNLFKLYWQGELVDTATSATASTPGSLSVGNSPALSLPLNGTASDVAFGSRILDGDEIRSVFGSNGPMTITRSNWEWVLTEAGAGKITGNAGGIYAEATDGSNSFTLLNSTQTINGESLAAASMLLGDNHATTGSANLLYDGAAGTLSLRNKQTPIISLLSVANAAGQVATFDGVIGITTSGGIWQGSSGTFASPTTGFKLYTSSSKAIWEAWNAGTKQVYIDPSDMSLRAGAGAVVLSSTGMTLTGGTGSVNQIKWLASGNLIGYAYTSVVSSVNTMALLTSNLNGFGGLISLNAQASGGAFTTLEIDSILGQITASKMLVVTANGIKTTDFGNTPWKLGGYTGGAPAATGYVQVNINGTTYKLLAST